MFPELSAILAAPSDCSAHENAERDLFQHVHADDDHCALNRADGGPVAVIRGIGQTQDPGGKRLVAGNDPGKLLHTRRVVIR